MGLVKKRVLITCGPTWVAIDKVRVISNRSTGQLGHLLANGCLHAGARVTLLEGPVEQPLKSRKIRVIKFQFYDELAQLLKTELRKSYSVVIHAAAVADYRSAKIVKGKISSGKRRLFIPLIPTQKIINLIKNLSPQSLVVGFKLEDRGNMKKLRTQAKKLLASSGCDFVVGNTLPENYQAYIFDEMTNVLGSANSRTALAKKLVNILKQRL